MRTFIPSKIGQPRRHWLIVALGVFSMYAAGCGDLSPGIDGQVGATPVPSASSEWRGTTKTASTVLEQPGGPAAVPVSSMRSEVAAIRASHELTGERVERVAAALIERARASLQNPLQDMTLLAEQDGWTFVQDQETGLVVAVGESTALVFDPTTGSFWGSACRSACWAAGGLGCAVVGALCAGVTVITIGGTSIPCSWALIAACTASGAGASICADMCPK